MGDTKRNIKGQGTFVEMENGKILHRKYVESDIPGKRKVLTVRGDNRAICVKLMKKKEKAWEERMALINANPDETVADLCKRHLEFQVQNGELKPKSVDRREDTIKNQIEKYSLGYMQTQAVTPADIDNHISALIKTGLSPSTIKKVVDVLNAALEWAAVRNELHRNPAKSIKKLIMKRLSKLESKSAAEADVIVLSEEEEERFLQETLRTNDNNGELKYSGGLYGRLLLHSGMRVGELISLRWKDYDKENGYIVINKSTSFCRNRNASENEAKYIAVQGTTKNQKARVLQLFDEAIEDLDMIMNEKGGGPDDLICRTKNNKQYSATMMEHCMGTVYKNAGLDDKVSGLHILRRTFATRMYENGADTKEIAAYIGDLESTTMQYYIAARKKVIVGGTVKQIVPRPGYRINKENEKIRKGDAPAGNRNISE